MPSRFKLNFCGNNPYSADIYFLQLSWPKKFLSGGQIEIRSTKDERILFTSEAKLNKVQDFVTGTGDSNSVLTLDQGHLETKVTGKELASWKSPTTFRFCLKKSNEGLASSFCSRLYLLTSDDGIYRIQDSRALRQKDLGKDKSLEIDEAANKKPLSRRSAPCCGTGAR